MKDPKRIQQELTVLLVEVNEIAKMLYIDESTALNRLVLMMERYYEIAGSLPKDSDIPYYLKEIISGVEHKDFVLVSDIMTFGLSIELQALLDEQNANTL